MTRLQNRIALVTGSSRGIGLAIARALAREGAIPLMAGRDRTVLMAAARQIPRSAAMVADVTRPASVARLFRRIRKRFGQLDILVNNAGVFTYKPFRRTTLADWRVNVETNLTALFLVTQAALPLLERGRNPHLVNILSISSLQAFPKCSAYTASKFGALGLTRVLREELRASGIRVTAVFPGATDTRQAGEFDFPVRRERLLAPEDVAEAVVVALTAPRRALVEEIVLMPSSGQL